MRHRPTCMRVQCMIKITITCPKTIEQLRLCYANKLNTVSMGARRKANRAKKRFKALVRSEAKIQGRAVDGQAIILVVLCLPRCDWDAPIKAICDAVQEIGLKGRDDRSIKYASVYLIRPSKRKKRKPFVITEIYSARDERGQALERSEQLLTECVAESGHVDM